MIPNPKIICVLGPPRCGTSLTTRILNLLGVYLGPEKRIVESKPVNLKGDWEHTSIRKLNDKILSRLGGDWHQPPDLPSNWKINSEFENLREQARVLIQQDFGDAEIWGWKDPRTCLTLPFWQQLLPEMQYVICLRKPLDMARSLEHFIGCTIEQGIYLWIFYLRFAIKHTIGQRRMFVSFEDTINYWKPQLKRFSQFLGRPGLAKNTDVEYACRNWIDPNLLHHRTSDETKLRISSKVRLTAQQMYDILRKEDFQDIDIDIDETLREALTKVGPEARRKETRRKRNQYEQRMEQLHIAIQELDALIPPGDSLILVDDGDLGYEILKDRLVIPFLERDGQYWGRPPDDQAAIREFERLWKSGANFIVFAWPAFWWLDFYSKFHQYLQSKFRCVLQNDRIIVFDLRP